MKRHEKKRLRPLKKHLQHWDTKIVTMLPSKGVLKKLRFIPKMADRNMQLGNLAQGVGQVRQAAG